MSIRQEPQWFPRCRGGGCHPRHRSVSAHAARSAGTLTRVLDKPSLSRPRRSGSASRVPSSDSCPLPTTTGSPQRGKRVKGHPMSFMKEGGRTGLDCGSGNRFFRVERRALFAGRNGLVALRPGAAGSPAVHPARTWKAVDSESPFSRFLPVLQPSPKDVETFRSRIRWKN